ncbi:PITH domain-containing protein CG6153 [Eumeta japonica]|uniref:PITH domain-containing protein CG6153 n=1 Tax=Eumeta variegata TaxID=151549 RepID=A0A4C1YCP2_EUMVA|nr:PITH domain-containing protein CG6153 [Eumeta japonica]
MSHHQCHAEHDHDNSDEIGVEYSLYEKIDKENLECLNELVEGSGKTIFKPWEKRFDRESIVQSDADEELLFNIPFTGNVKLKGIKIIAEDSESHPSILRLYKNRPHMTFDDVSAEPNQCFDLQRDSEGILEYSPKIVTFSSVTHLTMHFPSNFGAENTVIHYIGLRGEWTTAHRHGVTICTYEATPNLGDHKINHFDTVSKEIQ